MNLPIAWTQAELGELVTLQTGPFGSSLHQSDYVYAGVPLINPMHICDGVIRPTTKHTVSAVTAQRLSEFRVMPGDLVIGRRGEMGRCAVVSEGQRGWLCGTGSMVIRCSSAVIPTYLQRVLSGAEAIRYLGQASVGSTMANLNQRVLLSMKVTVPPLSEQQRIVDAVDELFPSIDAGVAELQAARKKLAQYRQSLLKAAVEGSLTADWRAAHPPQESGEALLARILQERRARWEARQLDKFKAQGKTPPKGWQSRYPEPVAPDVSSLHGLPDGWRWVSLDMLGEIASGVAKGSKAHDGEVLREVPYLRVANVQRGYLDMSVVKTILASERDIEELALRLGDVLFNEGGDRDKLGRGWVWQGELPECIHQNHVFRLRPLCADVVPEFISHHGNTFGQKWFQSAGKQTTNLASINLGMLRSFPVPLAPADEQREIARRVAKELETISAQEAAVEHGLRMAASQRQNILRAAFSGQLVPQDPADEPASALLARIRTERAMTTAAPKAARRTRVSA